MNTRKNGMWKAALGAAFGLSALTLAGQAAAQITFYEGEGFRGRAFTTGQQIRNFERSGYNDRASSVVVDRGRWEVCTDAHFEGNCVVLRRGSYENLSGLGLNNRISSVRPVNRARYDNEAPPPLPQPTYEYRRRPNERVYEANVTSVRAVMGPPERRCWVEREQVAGGDRNVGGAVAGAILGGILGHQIGSGRGNDAATALGAVAGAAIGSNTGRGDGYSRDVQRCASAPGGRPAYWDVTYEHRGRYHTVQMSEPPGRTILVNNSGVPRQ